MSRPIIEPTPGATSEKQGYEIRQLQRRPAMGSGGCGSFTDVGTTPPFQNSWVNVGGTWQHLRFRLCDNDLEIEGFVQGGADGTVVFTIPLADRPAADLVLIGMDSSNQPVAWIVDASTGTVTYTSLVCATGPSGGTGPTGPTGPTGAQGVRGVGGLHFLYSTDTASSDPGSGFVKFNSTTLSSINALRISETDTDGGAVGAYIQSWDDSTSTTVYGTLLIRKDTNPAAFIALNITGIITDNGTWDSCTLSYVASSGSFSNNDDVRIIFSRTGGKGDTGPTGPTGSTGAGADPFNYVTKTGDESVSSSTTLQNDDELFFATASGEMYEIYAFIQYASPTGAGTPDLKTAWGEDGTTRGYMSIAAGISNTDSAFSGVTTTQNQTGTIILGTAAADRVGIFMGIYLANGGTWRFLWAQNTSGANATIVRAGSVVKYRLVS